MVPVLAMLPLVRGAATRGVSDQYELSFDPESVSIGPGGSRSVEVTASLLSGGAAQSVTLSLPGIPAGYSGVFSDNPITSDGGQDPLISDDDFSAALDALIAQLIADGFKVILSKPTGSDPGHDIEARMDALDSFMPRIESKVDDEDVFQGDFEGVYFFREFPANWKPADYTHLTNAGNDNLGNFVAKAVNAVFNPGGGGGSVTVNVRGLAT